MQKKSLDSLKNTLVKVDFRRDWIPELIRYIEHCIDKGAVLVLLFGSRAKGTAREDSDYDLLIIQNTSERCRKIAQNLYLHLDLPVSVDFIVQTPETVELNKKMFYSVVKDAINEGKVIYESRG